MFFNYYIMRFLLFFTVFSNIFVSFSCKNPKTDNSKKSFEKPSVTVQKLDAENNENLFEQILCNDSTNNNLIVFIDPHGDGKFVLNKVEKISKNLNSNIIFLNNVKNGDNQFVSHITESIEKYIKTNNKTIENLYLIGFSGGARMAFQYALNNKTNGVVMCGAGIGANIEKKLPFPLVLISGFNDFNFIEQYYSPFSQVSKNKNVISIFFDGKHKWANNDLILQAINFLKVKNNDIYSKKQFNLSDLMNNFNDYKKHQNTFLAFKEIEFANKIFDNNITNTAINNFLKTQELSNFVKTFELFLTKEQEKNNELASNLEIKNWNWWEKQISEIDYNIKNTKQNLETNSLHRTKAFLGMLMYSVVSKEIEITNSQNIDKYLKIYEKLEPQNADMLKFKDIYINSKTNN